MKRPELFVCTRDELGAPLGGFELYKAVLVWLLRPCCVRRIVVRDAQVGDQHVFAVVPVLAGALLARGLLSVTRSSRSRPGRSAKRRRRKRLSDTNTKAKRFKELRKEKGPVLKKLASGFP